MLHTEHPSCTATRSDHASPIDMDATVFAALELSLLSGTVASAPGEDEAGKHSLSACEGSGLLTWLRRLQERVERRFDRPVAVVVMQGADVDTSSGCIACWRRTRCRG